MSRRRRWYQLHGLERDPFMPGRAEAMYLGGGRDRLLRRVLALDPRDPPACLVSGDPGSGKSLIHLALAQSLRNRGVVVEIRGSLFLEPEQIWAKLGECLAPDSGQRQVDASAVLQRLLERLGNGDEIWVVVDDAQELSAACLELLCEISEAAAAERFRLVLLARPGLMESLRPRLESLVEELVLAPYDRKALLEYLRFRVSRAGGRLEDMLEEPDLERIIRRARGNPGRAGREARSLLSRRSGIGPRARGGSRPMQRRIQLLLLAAAAMCVLIAAALWLLENQPPVAVPGEDSGPMASPELVLPKEGREASRPDPGGDPEATLEPFRPEWRRPVDRSQSGGQQADIRENPAGSQPAREVVEEPPDVVPAAPTAASAQTIASDAEPDDEADAAEAPVSPEVAGLLEPIGVPSGLARRRETRPDPQPVAPRNGMLDGAAEIMRLSENALLVQVLVTRSADKALDWIRRPAGRGRYIAYPRGEAGETLYVIVHGPFYRMSAAEGALARARLPGEGLAPWIRQVADVQAELSGR